VTRVNRSKKPKNGSRKSPSELWQARAGVEKKKKKDRCGGKIDDLTQRRRRKGERSSAELVNMPRTRWVLNWEVRNSVGWGLNLGDSCTERLSNRGEGGCGAWGV